MENLRIDPEFRDKIPPLTDAEFEQLRENILADGEVYEPIVTWNGTIVDGHNRYKVIAEHPEIQFRVKEMDFSDKWEAFDWMYKKQLGRRNLTEAQREVLIGLMYKARKKSVGAQRGNTNAEKQCAQNENIVPKRTPRTDEILGKELGINHSSVIRAEHFADGVEAIRNVSPVAANKIMTGEARLDKSVVRSVPTMEQKDVVKIADAIEKDAKNANSVGREIIKKPRPMSPEMKDFTKKILDVVAEMENEDKEYDISDAIHDMEGAEDVFFSQIRFILAERKDIIHAADEGREKVIGFIDSVIKALNELKGEI